MRKLPLLSPALIALLIIAASAAVACGALLSQQRNRAPQIAQADEPIFPQLKHQIDAITYIEIDRATGHFMLERANGHWRNLGVGGFVARSELIDKAISRTADLRYFEAKTAREPLHHKLQVEAVSPESKSTRMTLKSADGTVLADVIAGKQKLNIAGLERTGTYVRLPHETQAWLAEGELDIGYDALDWSKRLLADIKPEAVAVLRLEHADGEVIALRRGLGPQGSLGLDVPLLGATDNNSSEIRYLAGFLNGLKFEDARRGAPTEPKHKLARLTVQSRTGLVVTLRMTTPIGDEVWADIHAEAASDAPSSPAVASEVKRINASFGGWMFKLPSASVQRLSIRLSNITAKP